MHEKDNVLDGTAISVGDGSLGGAAIGGSVTGPDAGVIHDPVGRDVAVPMDLDPNGDDALAGEGMDDERSVRDASLERSDPSGGHGSLG
jgi:hypothetical protein